MFWIHLRAVTGFFWTTCALSEDARSSPAFFHVALAYGLASATLLSLSFLWTLLAHCGGSAEDDPHVKYILVIQFLVSMGAVVLAAVGGWADDLPPGANGNVWRKWSDELCVDSRCAGDATLIDACGLCMGDNSTCTGCDGIPASGLTKDACGLCGGDGSTCASCMQLTTQHSSAMWGFIGLHLYFTLPGVALLWLTFVSQQDVLGVTTDRATHGDELAPVLRVLRHQENWDRLVLGASSAVAAIFGIVIVTACSVSFHDAEIWTFGKAALWIGTLVVLVRCCHPVTIAVAIFRRDFNGTAVGDHSRKQRCFVFSYILFVWIPTCVAFAVSPTRPAPMNAAVAIGVGTSWICVGLWWGRAIYILSERLKALGPDDPSHPLLPPYETPDQQRSLVSPRSLADTGRETLRSSFTGPGE
eukprot:COSAG05_NODE_3568_length_1987_cov_1.138242_1_plen_416_part_00